MSQNFSNPRYGTSLVKGKVIKSDRLYPVSDIQGIKFEGDSYSRANGKFASESTIDVLRDVGKFGISRNEPIHVSGLYAPYGAGHKSHFTGDKSDIPIRNLDNKTILELGEKLANDPRVNKILYSGPGHEQLWKKYPDKFDKQTLVNSKYLYDLHKTHFDIQTLNDTKYQKYKQQQEKFKEQGKLTGQASNINNTTTNPLLSKGVLNEIEDLQNFNPYGNVVAAYDTHPSNYYKMYGRIEENAYGGSTPSFNSEVKKADPYSDINLNNPRYAGCTWLQDLQEQRNNVAYGFGASQISIAQSFFDDSSKGTYLNRLDYLHNTEDKALNTGTSNAIIPNQNINTSSSPTFLANASKNVPSSGYAALLGFSFGFGAAGVFFWNPAVLIVAAVGLVVSWLNSLFGE